MYYNDHMPPHFQAKGDEYEAFILICTSTVLSSIYAGNIPKSLLDLVLGWAASHCEELMVGNLPEKASHLGKLFL